MDHYKENKLVLSFVDDYSILISESQAELEEKAKLKADPEGIFSGFLEALPTFRDLQKSAYDIIKSKALTDIENSLSEKLSEFLNEELHIKIDSFAKNNSEAELKITIHSKYDEWHKWFGNIKNY